MINLIRPTKDAIFLKTEVEGEDGKLHTIFSLPDSGNRAKCIFQHKVFIQLFPNVSIEPYNERITTAKKNEFLDIVGRSNKKIKMFFADKKFLYTLRPLISRKIQLPCLLSAHDLQQMKMKLDFSNQTATFHEEISAPLLKATEPTEIIVNLLYKERIQPQEEAIIPVVLGMRTEKSVALLIEPEEEFLVAHQLCASSSLNLLDKQGIGHIKLINLNDHPIDLKAGIKIGTASEIYNEKPGQEGPAVSSLNMISQRLDPRELRKKMRADFRIDNNHYLTTAQKNQLVDVLCEHIDVISQGPADIGKCETVTCKIHVDEGKTCKAAVRPLPPHLKDDFRKQLDAWLDKGIVERAPDSCPFSSPLVPVKKKNGQIRWAVDFRQLNAISRKDHRPVPNVFERLASLKSTVRKPLRYFACLDLQDAFHNIPMDEDSRDKTAIVTPFGLFRFLRMPFGLSGAPAAFAEMVRLLEELLEGENPLLALQILIYFDDCLLCAQDWKEFLILLRLLFKTLRQMNLKMGPDKLYRKIPWDFLRG
jgi:hypothetical protein